MDENACPPIDLESDAPEGRNVTETRRRARRNHACVECGDPIAAGTEYTETTGLWENRWERLRVCAGCTDVRRELTVGRFTYGELWTDLEAGGVIARGTAPARCHLSAAGTAGATKLKQMWGRLNR